MILKEKFKIVTQKTYIVLSIFVGVILIDLWYMLYFPHENHSFEWITMISVFGLFLYNHEIYETIIKTNYYLHKRNKALKRMEKHLMIFDKHFTTLKEVLDVNNPIDVKLMEIYDMIREGMVKQIKDTKEHDFFKEIENKL